VHYDDKDPWPLRADGHGATLELISPEFDNSKAESWSASENHGSPGRMNTQYNGINQEELASIQFKNHPNPFSISTSLSFNLNNTDLIDLSIYDSNGELVEKLSSQILLQGHNSVNWKPKDLNSGIYIAILRVGKTQIYSTRIVYLEY